MAVVVRSMNEPNDRGYLRFLRRRFRCRVHRRLHHHEKKESWDDVCRMNYGRRWTVAGGHVPVGSKPEQVRPLRYWLIQGG